MRHVIAPGIVAGMASCVEPTIQATLLLPDRALDWDTSCVSAMELLAIGYDYPSDPLDVSGACVPLDRPPTFADTREAVQNRVELALPRSGLRGLELVGHTGPCGTYRDRLSSDGDGVSWDVTAVFQAYAPYKDDEVLALRMTPAASCTTQLQTVRVFDLDTLLATRDCNAALLDEPGPTASVSFGTLSPLAVKPAYFSGTPPTPLAGGVGTAMAPALVDPQSCLAARAGTDRQFSVSCLSADHRVCSAGAEYESAVIDQAAVRASLDVARLAKFRNSAIIGSVWGLSNTKFPLAGATVDLGEMPGEVVYVEPSSNGLRPIDGATATGPSGLFVVYTNVVGHITVSSPRGTRRVTVASHGDTAVSLIGM